MQYGCARTRMSSLCTMTSEKFPTAPQPKPLDERLSL